MKYDIPNASKCSCLTIIVNESEKNYEVILMRRFFDQPALRGWVYRVFFNLTRTLCRSNAEFLVLCVSWFARKLAHRQKDRHGEYISVFFHFFLWKKTLKSNSKWKIKCSSFFSHMGYGGRILTTTWEVSNYPCLFSDPQGDGISKSISI